MNSASRILWILIFFAAAGSSIRPAEANNISRGFERNQSDSFPAPENDTSIFTIDRSDLYSLSQTYLLDDSLSGKNLTLVSKLSVKASANSGAMLVLSIVRNDSSLFWHGVNFNSNSDSLQWVSLHDTVYLPASVTKGSSLQYYIWNPAQSILLVTKPQVQLNKLQLPVFTPTFVWDTATGAGAVIFRNDFYQLMFDQTTGQIWLADSSENKHLGPLHWWSETVKPSGFFSSAAWKYLGFARQGSKTTFSFTIRTRREITNLHLVTDSLTGHLSLEMEVRFKRKTNIWRQALIVPYHGTVEKVFRQNALLDKADFQLEYYLGKGGAIISDLALLHQTSLSSVQLNTKQKTLIFNLDYAEDHPLIHYPLSESIEDHFEDISFSHRRKNKQVKYFMDWFVGVNPRTLPRFMPVPAGYQAAVIWTEHADWADIRTHRAVNFGHDSITEAGSSTGGFVYYDIPVTRSVFYHNPDSVTNTLISGGLFNDLHSTIKTDTAFYNLLQQLRLQGHEICLHSPEQYSSNRKWMKSALQFMQQQFGSPVWIDHGYGNSAKSNRENLVGDGLLPGSRHFSADLWKQYGIRYFWNPSLEEKGQYNRYGFYGNMMIPYPGFGDVFPVQAASKHPAAHDGWLWNTSGTLEVPEDGLWDYYFHPERLENLVAFNSVWINHVYPAWASERKGFWQFDGLGGLQAMPGLNRALHRLAAYKQKGLILPMTIQSFMDYREAVELCKVIPVEANKVLIVNQSGKPIKDLSLAIHAESVWVDGAVPQSKRRGDDIIFWFDLGASHTAVITFE